MLEGSAAAKIHFDNCTNIIQNDSETEDLNISNLVQRDEKELLIDEVFSREPLWNSQLPYAQRSHNITSTLWKEIDIALGKQETLYKIGIKYINI